MEPPRLTVGPLVNNHLLWATRVPCICSGGGGGGDEWFPSSLFPCRQSLGTNCRISRLILGKLWKTTRYKEYFLFGRTYLASPLLLTKIGFRQPRGATRLGFRRRIWFRQYPGDSRIILENLTGKYLYLQRKSLLRKSSLFRQSNAGEKLTTGKQTKRRIEPVPGRQIVDCWASLLPPTPLRLLFFLLTSLHAVPTIWIPGAG